MEDVDRIRQLYQETGSCRKVAIIMGISRNTVEKYLNRIEDCKHGNLEEILPYERNITRTKSVCNEEITNKIHSYLEENQKKPKKQRLNALPPNFATLSSITSRNCALQRSKYSNF